MDILGIAAQDLVGMLFLLAVVAFGYGVSIPRRAGMGPRVFGTASTQEYLEIIGSSPPAWRRSAAWIAVGSLFNLLGFGLLTVLLRQAGDYLLNEAGLLMFLMGILFIVMVMAFRIGVETLAAKAVAETDAVPDWFEAMQAWDTTLGLIYMVLGYVATGLFGWAILQTALLPAWIGWVSVVLGIAGALSMIANAPRYPGTDYSLAAVPAWMHIMPLIIGLALLIQA